MYFIHSRLSRLYFALKRDIVDHRDIQLLFFFNGGRYQFLMNVYSDNFHTTVNSLAGEALNISNLLYMSEDLNIRDAEQNLSVSLYPIAGQTLRDLADFYSLVHSFSMLSVSTNYSNITDYANSVIDLIFLGISYVQIIHYIEPNLR